MLPTIQQRYDCFTTIVSIDQSFLETPAGIDLGQSYRPSYYLSDAERRSSHIIGSGGSVLIHVRGVLSVHRVFVVKWFSILYHHGGTENTENALRQISNFEHIEVARTTSN